MAFGSRGGPVFWLVVAITAMVVGALPSSHRDHQEYPTHDTIVTDLIHTTEVRLDRFLRIIKSKHRHVLRR